MVNAENGVDEIWDWQACRRFVKWAELEAGAVRGQLSWLFQKTCESASDEGVLICAVAQDYAVQMLDAWGDDSG